MSATSLRHFPLGHSINESPHSVVVSLPTMADVIGYEEKDPRVLHAMQSGYPRFFEHAWSTELKQHWQKTGSVPPGSCHLVSNPAMTAPLVAYVGCRPSASGELAGLGWVTYPAGDDRLNKRARAFLQHTGAAPSSRCIENMLLAEGLKASPHPELEREADEPAIAARLAPVVGVPESHFVLAQGGMNAFYALFSAVNDMFRRTRRRRWVQLGWLYVDTIKVLATMCPEDAPPIVWHDAFDLKGLARVLRQCREDIAGIITEVPTNPLVQTPDVVALRALADEVGCPLILDPSVASIANVDVLPWADAIVVSLTKYTARSGDVLMGAAAIHPARRWSKELLEGTRTWRTAPCARDCRRIAVELADWEQFAADVSESCGYLAGFLAEHPRVDQVWWAGGGAARAGFRRLARDDRARWGAVLSFSLKGSLAAFYDAAPVAKGPSFGTSFTLMSPFVYLAHYDLVGSSQGRAELRAAGLTPELIRLSVGAEPVDDIIAALAPALDRC